MGNRRIVSMLTSLCAVVAVLGPVAQASSQPSPRDPVKVLQEIQALAWQKGPRT